MLLGPTNTYLFKRNMIHADLCAFCFLRIEDVRTFAFEMLTCLTYLEQFKL